MKLTDFGIGQVVSEEYPLINEILAPQVLGPTRETALLEVRANLSARSGKWDRAATDFTRLMEIAPNDGWLVHQSAPALVMAGDLEAYRKLRRGILARASSTNYPWISQRMALDCLQLSRSGADLPTVGQLADFAVTSIGSGEDYLHWCQMTKGLAEYQQERFAEAVQWAQKALVAAGKAQERDAPDYAVLAMAQSQLKHPDEARAALKKAVEITQTKLPPLDGGDLGQSWFNVAVAHIFVREARALIAGEATLTNEVKW